MSGGLAAVAVPAVDVLIVDDQAPFRSVARMLVGMVEGWRVAGEAMSGEEAVAVAAQVAPSVVLMDIHMAGMDGIEATRQILALRPNTRVVLLSSYAAEDLPPDAVTCGAAAYIRKEDLTPATLQAVLDM